MVRLTPERLRPAVLTGLALSLLVVGCAGGAADHQRDDSGVRPWSGAARFTADEQARLHEAVQREVVACMRTRRLEYLPQPAADTRREASASPYGLLTGARARSDGYGIVGEILSGGTGPPPDANAGLLASMGADQADRWRGALLGRPETMRQITVPDAPAVRYDPDSCAARGRAEVYGRGWEEALLGAEAATNRVVDSVRKDAGYRRAVAEWSDCMAGRGYDYPDLQAPRAALARRAERAETASELTALGRTEIETASRDWACEREVRLHDAAEQAQRRAEQAELQRDPGLAGRLERFRGMKQRAVVATAGARTAG
ncbi:hypothetical protein [Streptomyces sp. NPDC047999]|uniref:hypothetical protein n=1 Tax=Streptomyces sp. NPDC047999 TaxID=3365497 RepID=UPI00371B8800